MFENGYPPGVTAKDIDHLEGDGRECCGNCRFYDGEYCTRNWKDGDRDYCRPKTDEKDEDDWCEEWVDKDLKVWVENDKRPSSITFHCPYCWKKVIYYHGSTSRSRRKNKTMKRCEFHYCPWCGREVMPLKINYIDT